MPEPRRIFNKEQIKELFTIFYEEHQTTSLVEYRKLRSKEMPSVQTVANHFGSWNVFLVEMNLEAKLVSKEDLEKRIIALYKELKRIPKSPEIGMKTDVKRYWGSYTEAIRDVLGINLRMYEGDPVKLKNAAVKQLLSFHEEHGRFPTVPEWKSLKISPAESQLRRVNITIPALIKEIKGNSDQRSLF